MARAQFTLNGMTLSLPDTEVIGELAHDAIRFRNTRTNQNVMVTSETLQRIRPEQVIDVLESYNFWGRPGRPDAIRGRRYNTIILDDIVTEETHKKGFDALFRKVYSSPVLLAFNEGTPTQPTKGEKMLRTKKQSLRQLKQEIKGQEDYIATIKGERDTYRNRLYSAFKIDSRSTLRTEQTAADNAVTAVIKTASALGYTVSVGLDGYNRVVYTAEKRVPA